MLDNLKLITDDQTIIRRLKALPDFERYKHRNNNYDGFCKYGKKMRLDFRKVFENGEFVGYRHCEISLSPHYQFNKYLHNGNDFTPESCIKILQTILHYIAYTPNEIKSLKVVNIEFALNIVPKTDDIVNLLNNILYSKRTPFITPFKNNNLFKVTEASVYKKIKAYAKGIQFKEFPEYGIDNNTFRFEVKSKKSAYIRTLGIVNVSDLLRPETYKTLAQELLNEWEKVLVTTSMPNLTTLKKSEVQFVKAASKSDFWTSLISEFHRDKFTRSKARYYKLLTGKNNLHTQIKAQIIEKLLQFENVAFYPQKTVVNSEKSINAERHRKQINGQFATPQQNKRVCSVTGYDISIQQKGSKFLRERTLKSIKETQPEIYKKMEKKYLTPNASKDSEERQLYLICKRIRDVRSSSRANRKAFETNYPKDQL